MRRARIACSLLLLPVFAAAASPNWTSTPRGGTLELGCPSFGDATVVIALPEQGTCLVQTLSLDGRPVDSRGRFHLSAPFRFRRVRAVRLTVMAGEWSRARLTIAFDEEPGGRTAQDPVIRGVFVNPDQAFISSRPIPSRDGDEIFDGITNAIRVDVEQSGLYRVSYEDLIAYGAPLDADPASFRLIGTLGRAQPFRLGWPGGSWERGWTPEEIPLQVLGGSTMNPDTELRFFLPGHHDFESVWSGDASDEDYYRHPYAVRASYFLTWGGAEGLRVESLSAAPQGGEISVDRGLTRVRRERNVVYSNRYLHEDGWAWKYFQPSTQPETFMDDCDLAWPDGESAVRLRLGFDAPVIGGHPAGPHHLKAYLGSQDEAHLLLDEVFSLYGSQAQITLEGEAQLPDLEGAEQTRFLLELPRDTMDEDYGYLLWYELHYQTLLMNRDEADLDFYLEAAPDPLVLEFSGWEQAPQLWDISDPLAPYRLVGGDWDGGLMRARLADGEARHLLVFDGDLGGRRPSALSSVSPKLLRNDESLPEMIVVYHDGFATEALRYASWRSSAFPETGLGEVETVAISDIYANFSSGMQDVAALRSFLKYRYDQADSPLTYVLLLGDADSDYRNFLERETLGDGTNSLVPALSDRFRADRLMSAYTTDDYIAGMDAEDDSVEISVPDLAVGRLPAASSAAAGEMVDRAIAYESEPEPGLWRNRAVLVADDFYKHCNVWDPINHTEDAEVLVRDAFPADLALEKIYLCEYECDYAGFKPESQQDLFASLEEGVVIFNYVGHGGNDVLADEQVLLTNSLYTLENGARRFLFISASCNVGEFDDSNNDSMSEVMMTLDGGGAIGTMAASSTSSASFNNILNRNYLNELFEGGQLGESKPIGLALLRAKVITQVEDYEMTNIGTQNERYSLLGDPALALTTAGLRVEFDPARSDTLVIGESTTLSGHVERDGVPATDFSGELHLAFYASADTSGYDVFNDSGEVTFHEDYWIGGKEIFRGRIPVSEGEFTSPEVNLPLGSATGPYAVVRAYATGDGEEAVGMIDSLPLVLGDVSGDEEPPQISLSLAGGATHVAPGTEVTVRAADQSGINLLGETPRNSIFLEFVETGAVENLTEMFTYDSGSASEGAATTLLPAHSEPGAQTLVASVADNYGNVGRDSLEVWIFEEGRADLVAVYPFPNPFDANCAITCEVTAPATLRCEIFTLAGRRIRSLEADCAQGGRYALEWDGRDQVGDQVANGTYLYRLEAFFEGGAERRRETRGAIVRMRTRP